MACLSLGRVSGGGVGERRGFPVLGWQTEGLVETPSLQPQRSTLLYYIFVGRLRHWCGSFILWKLFVWENCRTALSVCNRFYVSYAWGKDSKWGFSPRNESGTSEDAAWTRETIVYHDISPTFTADFAARLSIKAKRAEVATVDTKVKFHLLSFPLLEVCSSAPRCFIKWLGCLSCSLALCSLQEMCVSSCTVHQSVSHSRSSGWILLLIRPQHSAIVWSLF